MTSKATLYEKAVSSIPKCSRCEFWSKTGLSARCPSCDRAIYNEYQRMQEGTPDATDKGVLFDKSSAMFVKLVEGRAEFAPKWKDASHIDYQTFADDESCNRLLKTHGIEDISKSVVFIALDKFVTA